MRDFRQIRVWRKAHQLILNIYRITSRFPREEQYGLTSQLRRASASIAANIAEGFGRGGDAELARFLQMSIGSAYEVEYHALLAKELGFIGPAAYENLQEQVVEVKQMLAALFVKVKRGSQARFGKQ
ncbi:MAG TPA: four helix bundle protein [Pyrinomonadaceae bacterium]